MGLAILYILIAITVFTIYLYFYMRYKKDEMIIKKEKKTTRLNDNNYNDNNNNNERIFRPEMYDSSMYIPSHLANSREAVPTRSTLIMKERLKKEIINELRGSAVQNPMGQVPMGQVPMGQEPATNYGFNYPEMRALSASKSGTPAPGTAGASIARAAADGPMADLTGVDFSGATLTNADLSGADLSGADLSGATSTGVKSGDISGTPAASSATAADASAIKSFCNNLGNWDTWDNVSGISACIDFGTLLSNQKHNTSIVSDPTITEKVCGWERNGGLSNIGWSVWGNSDDGVLSTMAKHPAITWKPYHIANSSWGEREACYFFNNKMLLDPNFSSAKARGADPSGAATNWTNFIDNIKLVKKNIPYGWKTIPSGWEDWITG